MVHEIFTASGSFQILCRMHYLSTTSNYELFFLCPGKIFDFHTKYTLDLNFTKMFICKNYIHSKNI